MFVPCLACGRLREVTLEARSPRTLPASRAYALWLARGLREGGALMATQPNRNVDSLASEVRRAWEQLRNALDLLGFPIFMTEGLRSTERQAELYAQGRTTPGPIVTHAPPGMGPHEAGSDGKGYALDFAFRDANPFAETHPWDLVGLMAEQLGFTWGGRWGAEKRDRPHLEFPKPDGGAT